MRSVLVRAKAAARKTLGLDASPSVARWQTELAQRDALRARAKSERVPDVTLVAGPRRLSGPEDTALVVGVSVPLPLWQAQAMIERTAAGKLLEGYRGTPASDKGSVLAALVALGRLAHDLGDQVESIDINPVMALPDGQGAVALDALVVLRG